MRVILIALKPGQLLLSRVGQVASGPMDSALYYAGKQPTFLLKARHCGKYASEWRILNL